MKYLIGLLMFVVCISANGQESKAKEAYCEIVGTQKLMSTKLIIQVDYGEERKAFQGNKVIIDEATGKVQNFNSMVDALNYMAEDGWTFATAYTVTLGNQNVYHYLLKKELDN
jgi:hypothetical protein